MRDRQAAKQADRYTGTHTERERDAKTGKLTDKI